MDDERGYPHDFRNLHLNAFQAATANTIPSGKRLHDYGKSPCLMGKSTISMAIFNSKLLVHQTHMLHVIFRANAGKYIPYMEQIGRGYIK